MGYTVATPIKNERLRDQIVKFLDEHWRTWPELHGKGKDAPCYISVPHPDGKGRYDPKSARNLDYDSGACRIGFNFNAHEYERDYAFVACKWMAIRWGKLRRFTGYPVSLPHIVYDGHEAWPIFIKGPTKPSKDLVAKWDVNDRWGCRYPTAHDRKKDKLFAELTGESFKAAYSVIRTEMMRLDHMWRRATGEPPRIWSPPGGVESRA